MQQTQISSKLIPMTGFLVILFLAGCGRTTPPGIEFSTPEGQVINCSIEDNRTQMIEGRVILGTNAVKDLHVGSTKVELDEAGNFSYAFTLNDPAENLFSICEFKVRDTKLISNVERITFINGTSQENIGVPVQYDSLYLKHAVNVVLNEDMVNVAAASVQDVINTRLQEMIEAADMFPFVVVGDGVSFGSTTVTGASMTNLTLGHIDLNETGAAIGDIVANNISLEELNITGTIDLGLLGKPEFSVTVKDIVANAVKMEVYYDATDNDIDLRINLRDLGEDFFDQFETAVVVNGNSGLSGLTEWLVKVALKWFIRVINISIMDVDSLGFTFTTNLLGYEDNTVYGIKLPPVPLAIDMWFPENYVYHNNANEEMDLHLGLAINPINDPAVYEGAVPSPNPIGHYYSTPGDALPVLGTELALDGNNLTVGLNDDLINMGAWAAMETGAFDGLDITSQFQYLTGKSLANTAFNKAVAKIYMKTPPIADFSGTGSGYTESYPNGEGIVSNVGTFRVRDLIIEVTDLMANQVIDKALLSVDTDVSINLKISDDGKRIEGFMGSPSMLNIAKLYYGNIELTNLADLAPAITQYAVNLAIKALVKLNVPAITLYDANIQPHIESISVGNNNMIVKLTITEAD